MAIPSTNVDNSNVLTSMSSWLSGEERRLRSEGARVQVPEEAERFRMRKLKEEEVEGE